MYVDDVNDDGERDGDSDSDDASATTMMAIITIATIRRKILPPIEERATIEGHSSVRLKITCDGGKKFHTSVL